MCRLSPLTIGGYLESPTQYTAKYEMAEKGGYTTILESRRCQRLLGEVAAVQRQIDKLLAVDDVSDRD